MNQDSIFRTLLACALLSGCAAAGHDEAPDHEMIEASGDGSDESGVAGAQAAAVVAQPLTSAFVTLSNGWYGNWAPDASWCNDGGAYATGYSVKIELPQGSGDDTGMNGIRLRCSDGSIITSDYERYGNWSAFASCSGSDMMVGGNLRLEAKQGTGDDTSANYVQGICRRSDGTDYTINAPNVGGNFGTMQGAVTCPGTLRVCALWTRVEAHQAGDFDDTALNGVKFGCCQP